MTIEIDGRSLERRLNGLKKVADMGGEHNEYPSIYRHFVEALEFLGLKTNVGADGQHVVSKSERTSLNNGITERRI